MTDLLSLRRFAPTYLPFQDYLVLKGLGLLRTRGIRTGKRVNSPTKQRSITTIISNRVDCPTSASLPRCKPPLRLLLSMAKFILETNYPFTRIIRLQQKFGANKTNYGAKFLLG